MKGISKIAVLIACHNRKEKTINCLRALFNQSGLGELYSLDVFLVDDASTDGTADAVKEIFPNVKVIEGDGNLYWNRGMHLAWKTAALHPEYDFYLWINDDTLIFEDTLEEMLACYKEAGGDAIICGSTCSPITKEYTYGGKTIKGDIVIPNGQIQECAIMEGNCVLISRTIFKAVGLIDSVFPHAIGDHDYGLRAIKKGFRILVARKYIGYCEQHETLPKWCLKEVPFNKRMKSLYSPLGNAHPTYFFIYERRHFGLFVAIRHYLSIHLRALIPSLWK